MSHAGKTTLKNELSYQVTAPARISTKWLVADAGAAAASLMVPIATEAMSIMFVAGRAIPTPAPAPTAPL